MKCKKCGREINESSIETCFDCGWQEERSYDVKLFDVELFNLFSVIMNHSFHPKEFLKKFYIIIVAFKQDIKLILSTVVRQICDFYIAKN